MRVLYLLHLSARHCRQLTSSDIDFPVVRPLVLKYARLRNMATVYACMVVRSYFLEQSASELAHSSILISRATLCEIMALKLLSHFAASQVQLVAVLTTPWNPLSGAPADVVQEVKETLGGEECMENAQSAIEVSVLSDLFIFTLITNIDGNSYQSQSIRGIPHCAKCREWHAHWACLLHNHCS